MTVSTVCLGTMMFGSWGNPDESECRRIVDLALDRGVNFVDTADVYDFGTSEEIVGRALEGRRDEVVLATKFHNAMDADPNHRGNSRRWIVRAAEDSLRRLRTDWIDLYQVHRPDPGTDIDETLGALSDLVHSGKVRAIGTSTFPAEQLVEAAWVAQRRGRERFATEQPPYSIFARGIERDVLAVAERLGLGVLVWAPLNGGWLSGKYRRGAEPPSDSRAERSRDHFDWGQPVADRKLELVERLGDLAEEAGRPLAHLAIAFTLAHRAVTSAIVGPRTLEQLEGLLGAESLVLDDAVLDAIDELVPPGTNLNPANAGYDPPAILDPAARRR
ncbi:MAG TPA: aldo/keto reductase [Acidimicrobiales bacterium]|nr:aldo/keto reductase [Acidimicrobiales bacterium]